MAGKKDDQEKPRMDLIRPEFTEGMAKVLSFGAKKYGDWNWAEGINYSRLIAAIERHTNAIKRGEDTDSETGLLHAYAIGCEAMFLACFQEWGYELLDDRFEPITKRDR